MVAAPAVCLALMLASAPASAHPHVYVTVESTVLIGADTTVSGIRHVWTFDEMYSAFAIQGLDKKGGNNPTREDMKELAELNVQSLKEFGYFTSTMVSNEKAPLKGPVDYYLEHTDGKLSLHFTLPLEKPVIAAKAPFAFAVTDPTYFIAFQFAKDKPLALASSGPATAAATGCTITLAAAGSGPADQLNDAFSKALGPGAGSGLAGDSAVVSCAEKK